MKILRKLVQAKVVLMVIIGLLFYACYINVILFTESSIVTLDKMLALFTGAKDLPPLEYENSTLQFSSSNQFPTASTCAIKLTLPTQFSCRYENIK